MGKIYNSIIAILFVLVGVLFFLYTKKAKPGKVNQTFVGTAFPVAYFDPDSVVSQYKFSISKQKDLDLAEEKADQELSKLNAQFDAQENAFNAMAPGDEKEAALIALQNLKEEIQNKKDIAQQNLELVRQKFQMELRINIEEYLVKFNTPKRFSYIIMDEPRIIYLKDSALDITKELIEGLNEAYED